MAQGVNMVVFVPRIILGNARFISASPDKQLQNTLTLLPLLSLRSIPRGACLLFPILYCLKTFGTVSMTSVIKF